MDAVVSQIEIHQLPPYQCRLGKRHTTVVLSRYKAMKTLTPDERIYAVYQHCCLRFVTNQITNSHQSSGNALGVLIGRSAWLFRLWLRVGDNGGTATVGTG